ncbi:hypothetical protein BUALT_Bualt09G0032400 [Buddleja alternifolia]|uniref:UBC core domain-containing protein n=1 Tax=Buddleja alternifolia TaxID=168488 RepID=A0AAV6X6U8_9LAMI|nr:hypothetical protein BUALT_Bualt09G0032400 [Buddleja alternifolia]
METPDIRRRIEREKQTIDQKFWFTAGPLNNDDFTLEAPMMGPMNRPYADHFFKLIIRFGPNFPLSPPIVLQRIRQLMAEPNVDAPHPSSNEALQLYLDDHDRYNGILGNEILECRDTGKRDTGMRI